MEPKKYYHPDTFGLEIYSPSRCFIMNTIPLVFKPLSYSEKKRNSLIAKMKLRKSRINKFIIYSVTTLSALVYIPLSIFIAWYFQQQGSSTGMLGIVAAMGIIVTKLKMESIFETDPWHISVKHKGKIYD
jgi:hypothetical protein